MTDSIWSGLVSCAVVVNRQPCIARSSPGQQIAGRKVEESQAIDETYRSCYNFRKMMAAELPVLQKV